MSSIFDYDTIARFLKSVLQTRSAADVRYSLRAMAKDLGISPAHLSQVMNGKKTLSPKSRLKVAKSLGLDGDATRYFYLLVQLESAPSDDIRLSIRQQLDELSVQWASSSLDADQFKVIADWWHIPLMEMTYLQGEPLSVANAAKRLGLSESVVTEALERLIRLGLLERNPETGKLVKADKHLLIRTDQRSVAFGHFLRQMMRLAETAMDDHPVSSRVFMTQTFCIDESQLEEARRLSREYLQRMAGLFEKSLRHQHVYQLNIQFFNLTDDRERAKAT